MKNLSDYIEKNQTELFGKLGVIFAFSNKQFNEQKQDGMKYVSLGAGVLCPKDNVEAFKKEHAGIVDKGILQDIADNGIAKIIERELYNHECFYTGDVVDCAEVLEDYNIKYDEVAKVYKELRALPDNPMYDSIN